jgi:hypothetical protein
MKPCQPLECALHEPLMMPPDLVQADLSEEFDSGWPGYRTGDVVRLGILNGRRSCKGRDRGMLNERYHAERVMDALQPQPAVGRPQSGKRRIWHWVPCGMFLHTTPRISKSHPARLNPHFSAHRSKSN